MEEGNDKMEEVMTGSIEGSAPVKEEDMEHDIKPGPYGTIVGSAKNGTEPDVRAEKIAKGQSTDNIDGVEGPVGGLP